ncbi:MAG: small-conductance mechanosensitive channel-like protein [Frankiales bacterium]|jgi:small conductance mechanosensitive channel|nr:small-conductance mechanosensitive channel-like protein [Frankiales bacterium]
MTRQRRFRLPRSVPPTNPLSRETLISLESRIKPDFKQAVGAGLLSIICLAVGNDLGGVRRPGHLRWVAVGLTIAFVVLAAGATRSAGRETFRIAEQRGGPATASALRLLVTVTGYAFLVLGLLQLLDVNLRSLLLGGVVTGVVLGIAAQQTLGNFFAGLLLMYSKPYVIGERVIVRSGALGGPFEGVITDAGLLFSLIVTDEGPISLPNSGLLASAIGPAPDREQPAATEAADSAEG